jgi:hypothetical protein
MNSVGPNPKMICCHRGTKSGSSAATSIPFDRSSPSRSSWAKVGRSVSIRSDMRFSSRDRRSPPRAWPGWSRRWPTLSHHVVAVDLVEEVRVGDGDALVGLEQGVRDEDVERQESEEQDPEPPPTGRRRKQSFRCSLFVAIPRHSLDAPGGWLLRFVGLERVGLVVMRRLETVHRRPTRTRVGPWVACET